jgi:N-acyl-D-amino-acid deacylase
VRDFREEVKEAIRSGKWYIRAYTNPNFNPRWAENIYVVKSKSPGLEGKSIAEIAGERKTDPWDTYFDIIVEDPDTRGVTDFLVLSNNFCNLYYTNPAGMVGLDVVIFDNRYEAKNPPYKLPSVNTYSAYPLFYTKLVRDSCSLTLKEAVHKTATMPARVHSLKGRGILSVGSYADIVLMDLPNLKVLGNELEPRHYPKGIEYVFVNGVTVVERGEHTGTRPGRVLKLSN